MHGNDGDDRNDRNDGSDRNDGYDVRDGRELANGTLIGGRYRLRGLIGKGGMGEVYAAEDMRLHGKIRALKVGRAWSGSGLRSAEEASLLMRLNHPHLPLIVDYFPADEQADYELMVMDYIDGITLQAYSEQCGSALPPEEVVAIGMQLAAALHYLHVQQPPIIHRDLKPTNAMIDRNGFVRLIDFGIAREFKPGQAQDTVTLGTPGFAAPEQEGERQSDVRTDVFGLGALLRCLLLGGSHHANERNAAVSGGGSSAVSNKIPSPASPRVMPAKSSAGISASWTGLIDVIGRMTDPIPAFRYSSMEEAKAALAACADPRQQQGEAKRSEAPARRQLNAQPRRTITVASLSPGSGATFAAITLAHLLARAGGPAVAAIEHPELEPEWHALLPAEREAWSSRTNVPADPRYGIRRTTGSNAAWYCLQPASAAIAEQEAELQLKHRMMLQAIEAEFVVTDVSSRWMTPASERQLASCDALLFIADPFPAKWTLERLAAARRICAEREHACRPTYWIANKDVRFRARVEWLRTLPGKAICSIPQLPPEAWNDQLWSGKWATAHPEWRPMLERSLHPIMQALATVK